MRLLTQFNSTKSTDDVYESIEVTIELNVESSPLDPEPNSERIGRCVEAAIKAFQEEWAK